LHILNVFTYFPSTQNRRREWRREFIRIYSVTVRYALMSLNFATFLHSTQYNFVAHELCTLHFQYVSLYVRLSHYSILSEIHTRKLKSLLCEQHLRFFLFLLTKLLHS
jgi:hypothetical protein